MDDNDIFVNFKYGDQIELADVSSDNGDFPSYLEFVTSAQRTFGLNHAIYFTNEVNARLREKVFMKYVKKFHTLTTFILYVKDEDPLNRKDEEFPSGPSTSVRSFGNCEKDSSQKTFANNYSDDQVDVLAFADVSQPEVFHMDVIPKQEMEQEEIPEMLILDAIPDKPDSSSTPKPRPSTSRQMNQKRVNDQNLRNPNNICIEDITPNELRKYICEYGGLNIFEEYTKDGTLSEASRKQFIRIVSQHLITSFGYYCARATKIAYAKLCVQLLPKYKTTSVHYYDYFYDPITARGALGDKLHYLQCKGRREGFAVYTKRRKIKASGETDKSFNAHTEDETESMEDATVNKNIEFIKNATIDDKEMIMQVFEETRNYRLNHPDRIIDDYINAFRLIPTLLITDFEYIHGPKNVMPYWTEIEETINAIYVKHNKRKVLDEIIKDWVPPVQTIIKVLSFLPPGNRGTLKDTLSSLFVFFRTGTSLDTIQTSLNALNRKVQIYAIGPNRKKITSFHLKIDDLFLRVSQNAYEALDTFFKIHFSLKLEFPKLHGTFLKFLQHYLYKIPIQETTHAMKSLALELQIQ